MGAPKSGHKRHRGEVDDTVASSSLDQDIDTTPTAKKAKVEQRRSLFVRSLPPSATNESLTDFFSQHFPVKHATVVVDQKTNESRGFGFVTLADAEDATEAKNALDKQEWDGRRIRIDIAEPRQRNIAGASTGVTRGKPGKEEFEKPPKLIVRNLPWTVKTSEQLALLFRSFGKVNFADLPKTKGKLKGFGFVTIRGKKNAEKALEAVNGKEVDGRTLAVDWAVDRETWESQQKREQEDADVNEGDAESVEEDEDEDEDVDEDEPADTSEGGVELDLKNFMRNHMQNLEDEDDEDDDDEDDPESGLEDEVDEARTLQSPKKQMTDNSATVFIRNLPFTTTDAQLGSFFGHFGKVRYARVVIDKVSDKPAGTGFVCFANEADAKACIKGSPRPQQPTSAAKHSILQDESTDPDGKYTLDGRLLHVAQAVNKQEAANLADNSLSQRREKDKRRLFLLSEGSIGSNSPLHSLLSPSEIQMRQASAAQRKKLVQKNPSLHVSLTRLALRNIPRDIGSTELKDLARKAIVGFAKDVREGRRQPLSKEENARDGKGAKEREHERKAKGKGIVRQAKVVFESTEGSKVPEKSGAGKSRGYGFIEYTSHHWALMGLRYMNGQQLQGDNGKKQRLVVEFAIENAQVVQRRRAAEERSNQQPKAQDKTSGNGTGKEGREDGRNKVTQKHKNQRQGGKPRKGSKADEAGVEKIAGASDDKGAGRGDGKEDLKQKLIARKRLTRKKKAQARGKA